MTNTLRLGEAIPALLEQRGIEVVFGIPGIHTIELYRGLQASGLRHITPRHEQGAGFMADGYARATGKVAACFIITGPGLLNIATAMGQAMADSIPMLVISSANASNASGFTRGRLHEIAGQSVIGQNLSVLGLTVLTPEQLVPALDQAFALFACARPGPVHIEIPINVLQAPFTDTKSAALLPTPPRPTADELNAAADLINAAEHPVVILGGGCLRDHAALRSMVEVIGAPVLLTANARGILPPEHKLYAGGGLPCPPVRKLIKAADVVLAIGTEFGETDFEFSGDEGPVDIPNTLIRVDIDSAQLSANVQATCRIVADAGQFTSALISLLNTTRIATDEARCVRNSAIETIDLRYTKHLPLIESLWRVLPDAVVVGDSTEPAYIASLFAAPPEPRRWMSSATGFGTLGYALPAAIGVKIGKPHVPVVCLAGDGGFQFSLQELASAMDAAAPVIILLWNDRLYGEILHYMEDTGVSPVGVTLYAPDFSALATAFGGTHVLVKTLAETEAALTAAADRLQSTIIEMPAELFS